MTTGMAIVMVERECIGIEIEMACVVLLSYLGLKLA